MRACLLARGERLAVELGGLLAHALLDLAPRSPGGLARQPLDQRVETALGSRGGLLGASPQLLLVLHLEVGLPRRHLDAPVGLGNPALGGGKLLRELLAHLLARLDQRPATRLVDRHPGPLRSPLVDPKRRDPQLLLGAAPEPVACLFDLSASLVAGPFGLGGASRALGVGSLAGEIRGCDRRQAARLDLTVGGLAGALDLIGGVLGGRLDRRRSADLGAREPQLGVASAVERRREA